MILTELQLQDFRGYKVKKFDFSEQSTLLVGGNGVGKTNALEAVALLSTGKSFRATREEQMIRGDEDMGRVRGVILEGRFVTTKDAEEQTENAEELEIVLTRGEIGGERVQRKRYVVNGVAKRRMDFIGKLPMVLFRPEDLELVLGNPTRRRDYLDSILEQVDRDYRRSLLSYKKGLRQRNRLLTQIREGEAQRTALVFWDQLLIKNGDVVMQKRAEFFDFINKAFARERISQVLAGLEVVYDRSVISEKRLGQYATEEVAAGATLVGPHRDDFLVQVERGRGTKKQKRDLAIYGSRGEQRLAVLALKLAELSFMTQKIGERPLLMLDDIFSELDHEHRADVLSVVRQQQTILTTTDLHLIDKKYLGKMKVVELANSKWHMEEKRKKRRIFVAVPFDSESKRGMKKILKVLQRKHWPVKWEAVEKLHVTLAFLGWIDTRQVEQVEEVVQVVKEFRPFIVDFKGLGGFPDLELPRVVWIGLKGDLKSLAKIYKEVRIRLEQVGFALDEKLFVPHVTLGRIRRETRTKQRQEIGKQVAKLREMNISQQLRVDRVVVYESVLRRRGSEYRELEEILLSG